MASNDSTFGADPKPYYLAFAVLALLELVRRGFLGYVPADFTAYLHAADIFLDGLDPYTAQRELSPRYDGFPYNYVPGTLFVIAPLGYLSTPIALSIDWIARCLCLVYVSKALHRIVVPHIKYHWVLGLLILWEPLGIDLLFGNLVTYLFTAFVVAIDIADRSTREKWQPKFDVALILCGVIVSFKPYWGLPIGYALLSRRAYRGLFSLALGPLAIVGLTVVNWEYIPSLRAHTTAMIDYYQSIDFYNLVPWTLAPILVIGFAIGIYFLKRGPQQWVWVLGCLSIPMWPRTASYSYTIMFPVMLWLIRQWGIKKGILWCITIVGPIPWFFRTLPYLKGEQEELWLHFIWMLVTIPVVIATLLKVDASDET